MHRIRRLELSDLAALMELNRAAGWNQIEADWIRLIEIEPEGCFGLWCEGRIVATATAVCYGRRLAWIGMVLTHPDYRRRGFARQLTEAAVEYADGREVEWIGLDATDMGRPLYLQLGFEDQAPIERWQAVLAPAGWAPHAALPFELDAALDLEAFGADRSALLARLARIEAASLPGEGFVMTRPGARALSAGPCVARTPEAAQALLEWAFSRHAGEPVFWDLLPANEAAVALARRFGFSPARKLMRMVRRGRAAGEPWRANAALVYAAAGFEYG
jgi:RimJ/RimL family protein N-acetyltransferase